MKNLSLEIIEFLSKTKLVDYNISPLAGDASNRKYYRLKQGDHSLILMDSSKTIKNMQSFLSVREYLLDNQFSVPKVFHVDLNNGLMILEDFGDNTLDKYLIQNPRELQQIYHSAVDLLTSLSMLENPPFPEFSKHFFLNELSVFTTWYIPFISKSLKDQELTQFNACWDQALKYLSKNDKKQIFVHKDLHCGNLFWLPDRPGVRNLGIIDFQSAKIGSGVYDITSLLYDCRLPLPQDFRNNLLKKYSSGKGWDIQNFKNLCDIYIVQRNIKILGNFAHLYQQKENAFYLKFLPNAWNFLNNSLENPILEDVKTWLTKNDIQSMEKFP